MIETIRLFAAYNRKADAKMMGILAGLPDEALLKDTGTFFKSISGTLHHLAWAEIIWLNRIRGLITYACIENSGLADVPDAELNAMTGANCRALFPLKEKLDDLYVAIAAETKAEDLTRRFRYKNIMGKETEKTYWHMLMHVFNHGTHHRGSISAMLDMLKIDNDYSGILLHTN
ncbi:MAG: DUF664 domain-containing protein [Spirochaetes bacterium]|nr:MAG: DUF664 domain-containing protein [Spirochaetota bacterium]